MEISRETQGKEGVIDWRMVRSVLLEIVPSYKQELKRIEDRNYFMRECQQLADKANLYKVNTAKELVVMLFGYVMGYREGYNFGKPAEQQGESILYASTPNA